MSSSQQSGKLFMSKGSILVVDDESEIREGLELLLKTEGYRRFERGNRALWVYRGWKSARLT